MTNTINELHTATIENVEQLHGYRVIADTSALLVSGTSLLDELPECVLVIPTIVISELEEKRGHSTLGFLARQWLRLLEEIRVREGDKLKSGVKLQDHPHIIMQVEPNHRSQEGLPPHLRNGSNDSTILAVATNFIREHDRPVAVLSNDVPMRLHATLELSLQAVRYSPTIVSKAEPWKGIAEVIMSDEDLAELYSDKQTQVTVEDLSDNVVEDIYGEVDEAWSVIELLNEDERYVTHLLKTPNGLQDIDYNTKVRGVSGRSYQQAVALQMMTTDVDSVGIVSLGGSAGTGKTMLALAAGIEGVDNGDYDKVLVLRSLHEMGQGQEMGFLPGDANDKIAPWAGAVYDALGSIVKQERTSNMYTTESSNGTEKTKYGEYVDVSPITYLRGRSLHRVFMIIEEAQNFSFSEILNILSRVGEETKVVLTFDAAQVDNKFLRAGNEADIWGVIDKLKNKPEFAHIQLVKTERSRIAKLASEALE